MPNLMEEEKDSVDSSSSWDLWTDPLGVDDIFFLFFEDLDLERCEVLTVNSHLQKCKTMVMMMMKIGGAK